MAAKRGGLFRLFVFLLLVAIIVGTAVLVVPEISAQTLKIADKPIINGKSIADMGLADVKLKELWPLAQSLFADNSAIVTNAPTAEQVKAVEDAFADETALVVGDARLYSRLLYKKATFGALRQQAVDGAFFATVINRVVQDSAIDADLNAIAGVATLITPVLRDALNVLHQYGVQVVQAQFVGENQSPKLQMLLSLDLSQYTQNIDLPILGQMNGTVYVGITYDMSVTDKGALGFANPSISVNGNDASLSLRVLNGLFVALQKPEDAEQGKQPMTVDGISTGVVAVLQIVCANLGEVGLEGSNILSLKQLGPVGLDIPNGVVNFIFNTRLTWYM